MKHSLFAVFAALAVATATQAQDSREQLKTQRAEQRARQAAASEAQWRAEGVTEAQIARRKQIESVLDSARYEIDGRQTPDLVPYHVRMQTFFLGYADGPFKRMLDTQLSDADKAILDAYAARHRAELTKGSEAYNKEWMAIAARAKSMNVQEIAGAINAASQRAEARISKSYRAVLGQLSAAGGNTVNDFARTTIQPMVAIEDPMIIANADPEFYQAQIVGTYEMIVSGQTPPPLPNSNDSRLNTFSGEGQVQLSTP